MFVCNFAKKEKINRFMDNEQGFSGLITDDGRPIFTQECVNRIRQEEASKKDSRYFIAQQGAQELGLGGCADITIFGGNRGGGKANTYRTKIATPSGYRKMGDLEVGDPICTPYNGVQRVEAIFEQGEQSVYTLHFDDGTDVSVTGEHRFWCRLSPDEEFRVLTTKDILERYLINKPFPLSLRTNVYEYAEIPLCGEVELNEKKTAIDLPMHPYMLGYISGDGNWMFETSGVKLTDNMYTARSMFKYGGYIRRDPNDGYYYLKGLDDEKRKLITKRRERTPAFIPDEYKTASVECRWDYLRGVMFKKGGQMNRHPYLALPNKRLIEDVADLARSLGIWVKVSRVEDVPGKIGFWKAVFVAPDDKELFSKACRRKYAKVNADMPTSPKSTNVLTKKIQYITKERFKEKCRCITVSGRDHLYMTEGYNINHNTVTMLMEPVYDICNKRFNGIIFRKNKDDFENIINESKRWFGGLGRYNKSKDDMTWYFRSGAKLGLTIYDMPIGDFDTKFRGQQFAYIGIDELPQMPFEMLKFLMTSNRNTVGVHSRILGTCNPDPLSWLRQFLKWWIGDENTIYSDGKKHPELKGFAIPERNGVVRYCYMPDNSVDNIIWGDTPDEVYDQCRDIIDDAWNPEWEQYGYTRTSFFVKSVTFIKAALDENKALLKNDLNYIASLMNQPPEVRARELGGNWDVIETSDDMIQPYHLDKVFQNSHMTGDGVRRATCDVAGTGGDNCVTWLWIGWHVADLFVCRRDLYSTVDVIRAKLREWGVLEENFTYDLNGMGQVLKGGFPKAIPFNNQEAVDRKDKFLYDNKKSQCAYRFAERTQQGDWSIEHHLLGRKYLVGKETRTLYDILQRERKCVRQDLSKRDKGWCIIHKEQMKNKSIVGHSPDFFEALFMREIFELKRPVSVPNWAKGTSKNFRITRLSPR